MIKMRQIGLFAGRFQPFHNGHIEVIKQMAKDCDEVIIVIGSAQVSHLPNDPFTASERYQMIRRSLHQHYITPNLEKAYMDLDKFQIIPVHNINRFDLWVRHVESLVPPFNVVYARSPFVQRLFKEAGYKVIEPTKIITDVSVAGPMNRVSATMIRKSIHVYREINPSCKAMIPLGTYNTILEIDGVERIWEMSKEDD